MTGTDDKPNLPCPDRCTGSRLCWTCGPGQAQRPAWSHSTAKATLNRPSGVIAFADMLSGYAARLRQAADELVIAQRRHGRGVLRVVSRTQVGKGEPRARRGALRRFRSNGVRPDLSAPLGTQVPAQGPGRPARRSSWHSLCHRTNLLPLEGPRGLPQGQ